MWVGRNREIERTREKMKDSGFHNGGNIRQKRAQKAL